MIFARCGLSGKRFWKRLCWNRLLKTKRSEQDRGRLRGGVEKQKDRCSLSLLKGQMDGGQRKLFRAGRAA